jgi:hypothetical protein
MSSGAITTEETRREGVEMEKLLREAGLVSNRVLRRALAIAACEYVELAQPYAARAAGADAGIGLMVCWVMRASEELEKADECRTVANGGSFRRCGDE